MTITIKLQKLEHATDLMLPAFATNGSAGVDLLAATDKDIMLQPHQYLLIPTGIAIALPTGYEAQIRPRSGLAAKHGVTVLNSPGTIDSDYRGEIKVILINHGHDIFVISRGMRIAQMVIAQYTRVDIQTALSLDETDRGDAGFGSTGQY